MTALLPIVERELRVSARRAGVYRLRYVTGALAGLAAMASLVWAGSLSQFSMDPGRFLFEFVELLAFLSCLYAGLFSTVDALSRENREGTLGLLFLTRLRGHDIVLGKFAAHALRGGSMLLTFVPVLSVSFCLGGVTGAVFWGAVLALANWLFFALAVGILVSTLTRSEGRGLLCLLAIIAAPTLLGAGQMFWTRGSQIAPVYLVLNPLYTVFLAFDIEGSLVAWATMIDPSFKWSSLLAMHALGWLALALASFILPWRVKGEAAAHRPRAGGVAARPRSSSAKSVLMPSAPRGGSLALWVFFLGTGLFWWWNKSLWASYSVPRAAYPVFACVAIKLCLAWRATELMARERMHGGLEILLTSPISVGEILRRQYRSLLRSFFGPTVFVGAVLVAATLDQWGTGFDYLSGAGIGAVLTLALDFFFLPWIGLWRGLVARSVNSAFGQTAFFAFLLPWLPMVVFLTLVWYLIGEDFKPEFHYLLGAEMTSAAVFGIGIGLWAMAQSHDKFRTFAASPFGNAAAARDAGRRRPKSL